MARSPLFRSLRKALVRARFLARFPEQEESLWKLEGEALRFSPIERREFLGRALAAGTLASPLVALLRAELALGKVATQKALPPLVTYGDEPVTIVGAGAAGLTTAYRLANAGVKCELFEASGRVGGRMFTQHNFNADGMFVELGGELVDTNHVELRALAAELGVEIQDFSASEAGLEKDIYFFGGKRYHEHDVALAGKIFFKRLARDVAAAFPDDKNAYVSYDFHNHLPAARRFDNMTLKAYLDACTHDVDAWVLDLIRVAYVTEFGLELDQQAALNILCFINPDLSQGFQIFGSSDEIARVKNGSSTLTDALARAIEGKVKTNLQHELVRVHRAARGIELTFRTAGATKTQTAEQVVLAMPFSVLRHVEGISTLGLEAGTVKCISHLGVGKNSKLMMGFKSRPWRKPPATGKAERVYLFTDLAPQCFWETSRLQNGASGIITNFTGGSRAASADVKQLPEVLSALEKVLPGTSALHDGNKAFLNWSRHPYALGSYTCQMVGQYTTIFGRGSAPELGGRVLFAGEQVSKQGSGYMNGAIASGNAAAEVALRQRGKKKAA
jgi:monoamine oxidase